MRHLVTTRTAGAGLIALAASCSPALADGRTATPYLLADMMQTPAGPAAGAMPPGGMMGDKMGAMPKPGMPGPAAGMAPMQPPGAPAAGGMPGMGMDDKMSMPPANAAAGAMPGMQPPGAAAPPSGMPAQMMQTMMQMPKPGQASAPLDHVEGRIAFIKAEVGITDAQTPAWDQFAQALRSGREHLAEARQALVTSTGGPSSMPGRLEAYEHHLSMRLDSMKAARASYERLDPLLTAAQRRTADELVSPLLLSF